ncbi:hypothetical protein LIER_29626 [Lithospermum erythrorhizon]|uniref:Uncharacterized protein n=1 Tax=Lithospermum erythrorhizon TaxID=34254 RepID=A0AAV3RN46_LITER
MGWGLERNGAWGYWRLMNMGGKKDRRKGALRDVSVEDNGGLSRAAMDGGEALVQENNELDTSSLKGVGKTLTVHAPRLGFPLCLVINPVGLAGGIVVMWKVGAAKRPSDVYSLSMLNH